MTVTLDIADDLSVTTAVRDDGMWLRLGPYHPETTEPWTSTEQIEQYIQQLTNRPMFWTAENVPFDPAPSVPAEISHRQFYQALWETDRITFEEAQAAVNLGTLPAAIEAFVLMLESDSATEKEGRRARLALNGAKTFERDHYFTMVFGAMFGMTNDDVDDLWRFAATL